MNAAPHIVDAVNELKRRLLPAQLNQSSGKNTAALFGWLSEDGINPLHVTAKELADHLFAKIKAHLFENQLVWDVEPKALAARKELTGPAIVKSAEQATKPFTDAKKAGEIADAKAKADAASIQQAKELIAAYLPTKSTARGEVVDYAEQKLAQTDWTKALNQAIEKKLNLQEWVKALAATIQKRYADREKASERL